MRGFMELFADTFSGIVALVGVAGMLMLGLGAMVVIDASIGDGKSTMQIFAIADAWVQDTQKTLQLGSSKFLGSYALALGTKLVAGALVSAVVLDIMYSLRTLVNARRR
jgi:hypothetical protein